LGIQQFQFLATVIKHQEQISRVGLFIALTEFVGSQNKVRKINRKTILKWYNSPDTVPRTIIQRSGRKKSPEEKIFQTYSTNATQYVESLILGSNIS